MFITENWHVILTIGNVIFTDELFHFIPLKNHSTLNTASHMSRYFAILIVTLNATSQISLQAIVACQIESLEVELTCDFVLFFIGEIDFWCPIDAYDMAPDVLYLINAAHDSSHFITQEALNIFAFELLVRLQLSASLTIPVTIWNIVC